MKPRLLDLPHGHQTQISEEDWPRVSPLTVYRGSNGYAYFSTWAKGRSTPQTLHRWLMDAPKGTHVDHINGDKLDNRRENLRIVTPGFNQVNRKRLNKNNASGVRGVHFDKGTGKWLAQITVDRKNRYLGIFEHIEDAIAARKAAEVRLFGEECP